MQVGSGYSKIAVTILRETDIIIPAACETIPQRRAFSITKCGMHSGSILQVESARECRRKKYNMMKLHGSEKDIARENEPAIAHLMRPHRMSFSFTRFPLVRIAPLIPLR